MKNEKPDWIFKCRKCSHNLYVDKLKLNKLIGLDCPECGEESPIFIFFGEGKFKG